MAEEYNDLEKELRHPAAALRALIFGAEQPNEKAIWDAIKTDIGWTESDIDAHFSFYSDWYKDLYGSRPRGLMPSPVAVVRGMWERHEATSQYVDLTMLQRIQEWEDASEAERQRLLLEERRERLAGVCLNGEPIDVDEAGELVARDASYEAVDDAYEAVLTEAENAGGKYEVYNDLVDRCAEFPTPTPLIVRGDVA